MNRFEAKTNAARWLALLLPAVLALGCGGSNPSSDKAITAYSLAGASGDINETAKTIAVGLPFGTSVTALVATFTTTGTAVAVGTTAQVSGTTPNNFSSPVAYLVTAADGSTATYTVTVTVAASSAKALTAFSAAGTAGTINETAKTVALTVPFGTSVTALVATFTTTGASVKVGATAQVSGSTANNFTNPVQYVVTAADGTTATYTVTVTVAPSPAKAITAYSLAGVTGTVNEGGKTIAVTMPSGTNVTALIATFTTTGASVKVGATAQVSGTTPNNFTSPVQYVVTAADATTATYTVTVTVAPSTAKAITAFSLSGVVGAINEAAKTIAVRVPSGTNVTAMIATFTTTGTVVKIGTVAQTSGTTANNFTSPVQYVVTAADNSTVTYTVTVTVAAAAVVCNGTGCVNLGKAGGFAILTKAGITDVPASPITGNIGTSGITGASITVPCTDVLTGEVFTDDANYPGFTCTSTNKVEVGLAVGDMGAAYTAASGMAPSGGGLVTACPGVGAFSDVNDSGPLAAGVYNCAVDVTIPGDLTLNGNATAVWVFRITGKLTQSSGTIVHLTGGALPQNVFWQVSDVVEIGTTAHMEGVILAQTAIHARTGSTVKGRLLAQTAVTLDTTTVSEP